MCMEVREPLGAVCEKKKSCEEKIPLIVLLSIKRNEKRHDEDV